MKKNVIIAIIIIALIIFGLYLIDLIRETKLINKSVDNSVYYTGFVFDQKRNFCVIKSADSVPERAPFEFKAIQQCEDANNVVIDKDIDVISVCMNEINQFDKDLYQESQIKSFKNDCIFDFALAKRDVNLCNSIDNEEYLKGSCITEVRLILNDKNICKSISDDLKSRCINN